MRTSQSADALEEVNLGSAQITFHNAVRLLTRATQAPGDGHNSRNKPFLDDMETPTGAVALFLAAARDKLRKEAGYHFADESMSSSADISSEN